MKNGSEPVVGSVKYIYPNYRNRGEIRLGYTKSDGIQTLQQRFRFTCLPEIDMETYGKRFSPSC
jgi:hypothetical protein